MDSFCRYGYFFKKGKQRRATIAYIYKKMRLNQNFISPKRNELEKR